MTSFGSRVSGARFEPESSGRSRGRHWRSEGDRDEHIVVSIEGNGEIVETDDVPDDVRGEAPGDWIDAWIRLRAERVLSYGANGAVR
jgi:hypothetical protein